MMRHLQGAAGSAKRTQFSGRGVVLTRHLARPYMLLDYLPSENAGASASNGLFVSRAGTKHGVTSLPFPTGRNFPKKILIFRAFETKLAQNLLDNSLSSVV
jgi:hypothetical protein